MSSRSRAYFYFWKENIFIYWYKIRQKLIVQEDYTMSKSKNRKKKIRRCTRASQLGWHPLSILITPNKINRVQVGATHSQYKPIRNIQINLTILGIDWQKGAAKRRIIRGCCPNLDLQSRRKDEGLPIK